MTRGSCFNTDETNPAMVFSSLKQVMTAAQFTKGVYPKRLRVPSLARESVLSLLADIGRYRVGNLAVWID
jgi:hypothetical protein